jgi:hypothetical protein
MHVAAANGGIDVKKLIGLIALATLIACSEKKPDLSILHSNGPDWVNKGSGAFGGDKGKVFYGVGIASGTNDAPMRRSTADSRARAEIAKTLDTYVAVLNKDYVAQASAGKNKASGEEQHVHQLLKTYSQKELSGATIVDHWLDTDGTEYSLAQLDMATFKDDLEKVKELSAQAREAVRASADKAFDHLSTEEAKRAIRARP